MPKLVQKLVSQVCIKTFIFQILSRNFLVSLVLDGHKLCGTAICRIGKIEITVFLTEVGVFLSNI